MDEHFAVAAADNLIPFSGYLPNGLSEAEQKILTLRLSEDLEYVEIAKVINMTEIACRMQYSRARRHCAELLERQKNT
ncbi:RNA polymerase sigma factor [Agathobaculum sp.]|uniref:RNA polymerase sigma factor n=1 Tax=Agathobaculum sp. TaxID=2048138 RepID=UPI003AB8B081